MRRSQFAIFSVALLTSIGGAGCGSHDGASPATASIAAAGQLAAPNAAADKTEQDKLHPVAVVHTSLGDITLRLDAEHAPISVDNFLTYVEQGHYDNTIFHQVLAKPAVILGGGYDTFRKEKPAGLPIRNEAQNGLKNVRGTVGMVRRPDSIDSSTSQFYFNAGDNPQLDHKSDAADGYGYCVFGEVTAGLEIVEQIAKSAVHDTPQVSSTPVEQVAVKWIHVVR
ncbi:MAG TPA: peptidylprolyl isomerase [Pirellulales bacterium]|jgi:peptidyl-prolyl cis-trans isomerase B (cyclophilin B)|nr:peptidylprolyl isomerase [Pirellulales bacterium]